MNQLHGASAAADQALVQAPSQQAVSAASGFDPSRYEPYRAALLAFHVSENPWMTGTIESLRRGWLLSADNVRTIRALLAAKETM